MTTPASSWPVLGRWILVLSGCAILLATMRYPVDLAVLLDEDDAAMMRQAHFFEDHPGGRLLALEASAPEPHDAVAWLQRSCGALAAHGAEPLLADDPAAVARFAGAVHRHLPRLLAPAALQDLEADLEPAALRQRLRDLIAHLRRPDAGLSANALLRDPLGLDARILQPLSAMSAMRDTVDGVVRHDNGRHFSTALRLPFPPSDPVRTGALMDRIEDLRERAAADGVHLEAIGAYRHFADNHRGIIATLLTTLPLTLAGIALCLFSLLRAVRPVAVLHIPALAAVTGGLAVLGLGSGMAIPLVLVGFGAAVLGLAIDYGIHMAHACGGAGAGSVRRPILISAATTGAAFACLIVSPVPAIRGLGLFLVGGVALALAATLDLVPVLLRGYRHRQTWHPLTAPLAAWTDRAGPGRLIVAALLTALLLPGLVRLRAERDLHAFDGSRPATVAALTAYQQRWGDLGGNDYLVARAADANPALAAVADARERAGLPPSPLEILLPDRRRQDANLAAWNAFWRQHGPSLRQAWGAACAAEGVRVAAFADGLARYAVHENVPRVDRATWAGSIAAPVLDGLLSRTDTGWLASSPVTGAATDHAHLHRACSAVTGPVQPWLASRRVLAGHLVTTLEREFSRRGGLILSVLVLVLIIVLRRPRRIIAVALPPLVTLVWTFGLLGWLGVGIMPSHILIAAFIAGIGVDDALFLSRPQHRHAALAPILATTATTVLGIGSLTLSDHPVLHQTGLGLALGMLACLASCLLIAPAVAGPPQKDADVPR